MFKGKLTYEDLPEIYEQLSKDLPLEGAEKAKRDETHKGYDTTGYGYQYHVNRMNEVLFGHWKATHKIVKETEGKSAKGKAMYNLVIYMVIEIGNYVFVDGENHFETLAMADGYGGHTSLEIESAHKGAYTNAFKKVSAMFGVGKKAFEGTLDEDLFGVKDDDDDDPKPPGGGKQSNRSGNKPTNKPNNNQPPVTNQPTSQPTTTEKPVFNQATRAQIKKIRAVSHAMRLTEDQLKGMMEEQTKKKSSKDLTKTDAHNFIAFLEGLKEGEMEEHPAFNPFDWDSNINVG